MGHRILVTGGLTGGHVMPALTVALALRDQGHSILFVGAREELEQRACVTYGVPFTGLRHCRHAGRAHRGVLSAGAVLDASRVIHRFRPDAVFSKGSVISVPVIVAARLRGVPVVVHESDAVPGSENRVVAPLCRTVCVGYAGAASGLCGKVVVTGNMVRPAFAGGERARCIARFGLPPDRPLIFVTGGSQGAIAINELLEPILASLLDRWSVLHQAGRGKLRDAPSRDGYVQVEFLADEIRDVYAAADLVVGRAGATTIAEAAAYRVPAVLVPYPWGEAAHQDLNARDAARLGVATVLEQPGLTANRLLAGIVEGMAMREARRGCYAPPEHEAALARVTALVTAAAQRAPMS